MLRKRKQVPVISRSCVNEWNTATPKLGELVLFRRFEGVSDCQTSNLRPQRFVDRLSAKENKILLTFFLDITNEIVNTRDFSVAHETRTNIRLSKYSLQPDLRFTSLAPAPSVPQPKFFS